MVCGPRTAQPLGQPGLPALEAVILSCDFGIWCSHSHPAVTNTAPFVQVPEIISSIRQAGKIARQEELRCPSEFDDTFAKKFEVLFCGRVTVAHKKAPPALIDECIEKFNHVSCGVRADRDAPTEPPPAPGPRPMRKSFSQPGLRSLAFRKEFQDAGLRSSTFSSFDDGIENHLIGGHNVVQPTDIEENRTMLFTVKSRAVFCTLEV